MVGAITVVAEATVVGATVVGAAVVVASVVGGCVVGGSVVDDVVVDATVVGASVTVGTPAVVGTSVASISEEVVVVGAITGTTTRPRSNPLVRSAGTTNTSVRAVPRLPVR